MNKFFVLTLEILLAILIMIGKTVAAICILSVLVIYCTNQIAWLKERDK